MKFRIYSLLLVTGLFLASSCQLEELLDSPNAVTTPSANPDFLLNNIQVSLSGTFDAFSTTDLRLTRIINQGGNGTTYDNVYLPQTFSARWTNVYASSLVDIQLLKKLAQERNLNRHMAIAKTLEAYILMVMVDHFNNIPYSEAFDPANFNPAADAGKDVYAKALQLLNEAGAGFAEATSQGAPSDLFYGRDYTKWTKLVNTLKLRYHLNMRLIDAAASKTAIDALIAENKLITTNADNFVFKYSTNSANPDSRHPFFTTDYIQGAGDYQSNHFMWYLTESKGFDDPRARYYMRRQTLTLTTNPNELRCLAVFAPNHYLLGSYVFCFPNQRGYWGRDHLDNSGIPPDTRLRTVFGLYPGGGSFDTNKSASTGAVTQDMGAKGAGIAPIMTAAYTHFMLAEAALMLGTTGTPATYLEGGITASLQYVRSFALASGDAASVTLNDPTAEYTGKSNAYLKYVKDEYAAATSASARMGIIGREYWLSLYGNGIEAYNLYRRTGQPARMQPGLNEQFGNFPRRYLYPTAYVERNNKATQVPSTQRVFWDNNPEGNAWVY